MKQQNHEETIMRAYVWSLYSNGETKENAEKIAAQHINRFKKAEAVEIQEAEGHNSPIPIEQLAEHISDKYLTCISGFIKQAESKKTLHDLDRWWQQHRNRVSMNLSEDEFNKFVMQKMPSLRSRFEGEEEAPVAVAKPEEEQVQPEACTELVVSIDPKQLVINDNFSKYAEMWRAEMRKADFIPQAEEDLKIIRSNEKKCKDVEDKIDETLQNISDYLEKALQGDPEVKRYTDQLIDLRKKMQALREETATHRKNIAHAPKRYMNDQKSKAVTEHLAHVKNAADKLFVGEIAKGRNDAGAKDRLVASYKGKRTFDTVRSAVEEEADRIIEEMNDRAARCRSNLEMIKASGRPALFQDQETLMTWEPEHLEQQIKLRVQQDELLKAQAQRYPQKLVNWKATISEIDNVPRLDNWYRAHWGEIKETLPHEADREELLTFCGAHKQKLKSEYAKSVNSPPPPEEPPQEYENKDSQSGGPQHEERQEEHETQGAYSQEAGNVEADEEEPGEIKLALEFRMFGTKEQAKKIAGDVYNLIGKNPMLQEDENGNKITLRLI